MKAKDLRAIQDREKIREAMRNIARVGTMLLLLLHRSSLIQSHHIKLVTGHLCIKNQLQHVVSIHSKLILF